MVLRADMASIRRKSLALGDIFICLIKEYLHGYGLSLVTPANDALRGSQISLRSKDGFSIMQALKEVGVIGDFRSPDNMRFGFAPLYTRYTDLWDAVKKLKAIMENDAWKAERFNRVVGVT